MNYAITPATATLNSTNLESDVIMQNSNQLTSTSVQNGTEIMPPNLSKYIEQYNGFARKTAYSIIELSCTLVQAKNELDSIDFELFAKAVNIEINGSTYKKLMVIGNNASRFDAYLGKLPQTWTTIYRLAQIKTDEFDHLVSINAISPFMTAHDITANITPDSRKRIKPKSKAEIFDVNISMSNLDVSAKSEIYAMLYAMQNKFNFKINLDSSTKEEITEYRQIAKA